MDREGTLTTTGLDQVKFKVIKTKWLTHDRWTFVIIDFSLGENYHQTVCRDITNDMTDEQACTMLKSAYEELYVRWTTQRSAHSQPTDRESLRQLGIDLPSPEQWEPDLKDRNRS